MNNFTMNSSLESEDIASRMSFKQRMIIMSLLIIFLIPAFMFFLLIFYYFVRLRKTLLFDRINHHIILFILISDFCLISIELPFSLHYLLFGRFQTTKLCLLWIFLDYSFEAVSLFLTMYASIERYILVFHKPYIMNHKLLFHYVPVGVLVFYTFGLYTYLVFLFPCGPNHTFNPKDFVCGGACYYAGFIENIYDTIMDVLVPCFILLIFNLLMISHVILRKRQVLPSISLSRKLQRNRRMILQLLAISLMALTTWIPWVILILGRTFFERNFGEYFMNVIVHYLPYFTSFASPFLALIGIPEIRQEISNARRKQRITPHVIHPNVI